MRVADLVEKIKEKGDLPKDVFVLILVALVGLGAFLLGRISANEQDRKAELRLIQTDSAGPTGFAGEGESGVPITPKELTAGASKSIVPPKIGTATPATVPGVHGAYVASKSGKAYYLPWCGGVKLIKEENKIWFATKEEAEAKGYQPAENCKGI